MHALGLGHEQTRPDRDQYVTILWNNIEERYKSQYQISGDSATLGSPYDYRSVMHYKDTDFQRAVGLKTMLPKGGNTISPADKATDLDIKKLKLLYQFERGFRNWGDMINNPCTSNCKCREGETGCGSNNDTSVPASPISVPLLLRHRIQLHSLHQTFGASTRSGSLFLKVLRTTTDAST
jgi:hypothetical protein